MTHGSLFSGGGGFDLAAEWMGWENKFHCEWNPFCQKILKHYWPNAQSYSDITKTDFSVWRGRIDIISGGFPCQPFSQSGKREGTNDSRYLWPEMLRVIREVRPTYVVGENVYGLVNWSGGLVFDKVQTDLENEGFKVIPIVLPAAGVKNAPHRRDRIWFVAYNEGWRSGRIRNESSEEGTRGGNELFGISSGLYGNKRTTQNPNENGRGSNIGEEESNIRQFGDIGTGDNEWIRTNDEEIGATPNSDNSGTNINMQSEREWKENNINGGFSQSQLRQNDGNGDAADTESQRHKSLNQGGATILPTPEGSSLYGRGGYSFHEPPNWENFPTQSPICNGDDGLSSRLDSITFPKWRNESIKLGGNAIVPQVALTIFKSLVTIHNQ